LQWENTATPFIGCLVFDGRVQNGHAHKRANSAFGGHGTVPTKKRWKNISYMAY